MERQAAQGHFAVLEDGIGQAFSPVPVLASQQEQEMVAGFDFNNGIDGWYYGNGWEYDYSAKD